MSRPSIRSAPLPTPQAAQNPWLAQTVSIADIKREIEGVTTYDLAFQDKEFAAAYRFEPGQFNMLYLPGAGEIAISLSDDPQRSGSCAHTIRLAGNVTRSMAALPRGATIGLRGPFGTSWPMAECIGRDVVLVAGGIGLAPLRPVLYQLIRYRRHYQRVSLLHGARSPDMLLYSDQYRSWEQAGVGVETTVDRAGADWGGNVGVVTLLLERLRAMDPANTVLLCCGPEVMMRYTVATAQQRGLQREQIWVSMERNMQCAVGLCGHCQLGPEFVCKDGPVFRYDAIEPFMDVKGL